MLWLNGIIQCLSEEDYQVEGVCAHFTINDCDSAVFKADIHTSRRKISKCYRMRKDPLKHEIYRFHFNRSYTRETVERGHR